MVIIAKQGAMGLKKEGEAKLRMSIGTQNQIEKNMPA